MTISKWTLDFSANQESAIAPVWVLFPGLSLPLYNLCYILKVAALLGRPLKVDSVTTGFKRPCVVWVLMELNVSKHLSIEFGQGLIMIDTSRG